MITIGHRGTETGLSEDYLRQVRFDKGVRGPDQSEGQPLHQGDPEDVGGHRLIDQEHEGLV